MTQYAAIAPRIIRESSRGFDICNIQDEMLANREIELVCEIDANMINMLIRELRHLQRQDAEAEITIFINSPGGQVSSGLALYDVMQAISCPIRTVCLGLAASMGALIFIAGDRRQILPHSRLVIHDPLITSAGGSALSVKAISDDLMRTRDVTAEIIAKHSTLSIEEVLELTAKDTFLGADESLEL